MVCDNSKIATPCFDFPAAHKATSQLHFNTAGLRFSTRIKKSPGILEAAGFNRAVCLTKGAGEWQEPEVSLSQVG